MNIGARIIKTGLSVALALMIAHWLNFQPAVLSAVAAVIAIQPSIMRSWNYLKEVILTNFIGGVFATLGFYFLGTEPVYIGIIVIITISINLALGLNKTVNLSVLTVIAILTSDLHGTTVYTVMNRFSLVGIGVFSSFIINILVMPPKHDDRFLKSIKGLKERLSVLLRVVPQKEISVITFKKEKEKLDRNYTKTKGYYDLLNEEKHRIRFSNRYNFIRKLVIFRQMLRVIKREILLFEKIEKHLNIMTRTSSKESEEVMDTINELLQYQETIFLMYEDKTIPKPKKHTEQKRKRIDDKLRKTVNELMEHYDPKNEELWWRLFPIVNALVETVNELEKLEAMVTNFKIKDEKSSAPAGFKKLFTTLKFKKRRA
ncbi:FUSC family protein [Bacillus toyonensis]|uniref:FUSC family protein n=1 Tax=Bacillus toyonensis TaxID=155322 RepID=UPI002E1ACC3C|nr:aromatic acid exporter family protein [Bacillus toyonensis]